MDNFSGKTLEEKIAAISGEIRRYPTPIARCDEQLTALLDERSRLLRLLEERPKPAGGCTPDAVWANDGGLAS
jgi:hypothetical protein